MELDKEQQARLTFLAEAETYFEEIETVLLGLKTADDRLGEINIAMRAAHSVKGTAGMMGFVELSQVAHQLEDAFKILRARRLSVDTSLETLLLQGVDCLRTVRQHYQQQLPIDSQWLATDIEPIFKKLNQHLGDLTPEDEARLLSEDNDENLDVMIFTTSVEDCLEEFHQDLSQLRGDDLRQAVVAMAQRMSEFGMMAQLEAFVSLCDSVQQQCLSAQPESIDAIAHQALKTWQRSHSLVLLGRTEGLPSQLKPLTDISGTQHHDLSDLSLPELLDERPNSADDIDFLQDPLTSLEAIDAFPTAELIEGEPTNDQTVDLEALQAQFAKLPLEPELEPADATTIVPELVQPSLHQAEKPTGEEIASQEIASEELSGEAIKSTSSLEAIPLIPLNMPPPVAVPSTQKTTTVRVSVDQLKQINSNFEALILNRNAVNLKLEQLQTFSELMQERMAALTLFNTELRQWYDRASTEGPMGAVAENVAVAGVANSINGSSQNGRGRAVEVAAPEELDALEFDRYSQLHLLAQEHMETIVKLEEVSRDIELGLNEMDQAIGGLNYTSRLLKNRITQTQMRPFEEIVGRFPRALRDWSVQYGKPVELKIEGASTLIEQFALDQLSDPLMHLLRNSFDHGIESPESRRIQQKPAVGTIALRAVNRGNRVVITLSDDGGGINLEGVRDRIRKYNLPDEQVDAMERQELLSFIFEPGFSTSSQVTELSGRGYGMDVVRTNLRELQGDIQVDTEPGQGTTFTMSIPLSLSILRVMLLERNGSVFALPVDAVQEVIRTPAAEITEPSMTWRDTSIPLVRVEDHWTMLARPLDMSGQPLINCPMIVVVGEDDGYYGLNIDRFWQEQEVAIRPVASPIPLPPGFSGVTVLGDGRVIPLIEPIQLMTWIVAGAKREAAQPVDPVLSLPSQSAKILVVDDSIHARRYMATTLERSGYLVEQAKDGREAVDKLIAGLTVEAIICDIEMPRLDGYGVLEELREKPEYEELPILMLTSRSSEKHRKLAMNLGATAYFSKPYNEQELLKELKVLTKV
ncbi:hybrid sensor histidine kinase/response regulator [Leptothoe sp. LEGE 181152]|nr:hybrid sensor histidine kinase/response regulator [Leptothoe sp. LEGE 181152]